jgi:glycosyltransferase involved in cell wall biosynthesis
MGLELVSVIMPVFNGERFIETAIKGMLNQSYRHFELICVDDGSTDKTAQIIKSFQSDGRIKYVYQPHEGLPAKARNHGIKMALGEYIAFNDDDDILMPDSISEKVEYLSSNSTVALVYSDCQMINEEGFPLAESLIKSSGKKPYEGRCFKQLFQGIFIPTMGVMVRKSILDKIGYFNENLICAEDYELWLRICHDHSIGYLNKISAKCRNRPNSLTKNVIRMDESFVKCLELTIQNFPDTVDLIGKQEMNERMYKLSFDVAYYYNGNNDSLLAQKWFQKCLKYKKIMKIYALLTLNSLKLFTKGNYK